MIAVAINAMVDYVNKLSHSFLSPAAFSQLCYLVKKYLTAKAPR
jgi:hypothetical protein